MELFLSFDSCRCNVNSPLTTLTHVCIPTFPWSCTGVFCPLQVPVQHERAGQHTVAKRSHADGGTATNLAQHSSRTENCFSYTTRFLVYFELLKWMNRRHASGSNLNAFSALTRQAPRLRKTRFRTCTTSGLEDAWRTCSPPQAWPSLRQIEPSEGRRSASCIRCSRRRSSR